MKLRLPIFDIQGLEIPSRLLRTRMSARRGEGGVALVVTLILLAIITFMAIAFLVLSRNQSNAVVGSTDQTLARLAADSALERARAEVLASVIASKNEFSYDVMVSTNYISGAGFINSG